MRPRCKARDGESPISKESPEVNCYGVTFRRWLFAAGLTRHVNNNFLLYAAFRAAWKKGDDPREYLDFDVPKEERGAKS